jgi:hypothetical protein
MLDALAALRQLHDEVDRDAGALAERHRGRLRCGRGCHACCVDGLTVLGEAGECRIYPARPYVCRTQGLPLRWLEAGTRDEEVVERRDICPLNEAGEPLETLRPGECWTLGPVEQRLRRLQVAERGGAGRRVALRDLFERS